MKWLHQLIQRLQHFTDRFWYEYALAFLAGVDHFIIVIPTDGLVISSALLSPKKWWRLGIITAIGSSLGALLLAYLVRVYGAPLVDSHFSEMTRSETWLWTERAIDTYGLWILFLVAFLPIMNQPAVILSALAHYSLFSLFGVILAGRLLKYLTLTALSRWAPGQLSHVWGVRKELQEVLEIEKEEFKKP